MTTAATKNKELIPDSISRNCIFNVIFIHLRAVALSFTTHFMLIHEALTKLQFSFWGVLKSPHKRFHTYLHIKLTSVLSLSDRQNYPQ